MFRVTVIGGMTVDIEGVPYKPLIKKDSNPGKVHFSYGGVGKNIAENLCNLGISTQLISAVGNDFFGKSALENLKRIGLSTENISIENHYATATYLSLLNDNKDMELALCDMDILEDFDCDFNAIGHVIQTSDIIVIDTNLSSSLIRKILNKYKHKKFLLDPVSVTKAIKVRDFIGDFDIIKPNKLEAEILSGIQIDSPQKLEKAAEILLSKGVKKVFITLGEEGVYFQDCQDQGIAKIPSCDVKSATGAGDAFTAGIIYGHSHTLSIKQMAQYGCTAAYFALQSKKTVNDQLTSYKIEQQVKEMFLDV